MSGKRSDTAKPQTAGAMSGTYGIQQGSCKFGTHREVEEHRFSEVPGIELRLAIVFETIASLEGVSLRRYSQT
jgi:hypothetical protein